MRVFITGGTGFVGSHVARRLVREGHAVHLLVRPTASYERISDIQDAVTIHLGDVIEKETLSKAISLSNPEYIFHFANAGVYGGISASAERLQEVNVGGLLNLLDALRPYPYKAFVNVGSSSEYGIKTVPMREDDVCAPVNAYGISKLQATECASAEAKEHKKPIATFRLFSPYGPYDDSSRLIMQAIRNLSSKSVFRLPHPDAMRDYVYIDDVVDVLVQAAQNLNEHAGEVFNVGSGHMVRAAEVVQNIATELAAEAFLATLPKPEGPLGPQESPCWVADMEKTKNAFHWSAQVPLTEGLHRTIVWSRLQV